jgi:hypothetical protein
MRVKKQRAGIECHITDRRPAVRYLMMARSSGRFHFSVCVPAKLQAMAYITLISHAFRVASPNWMPYCDRERTDPRSGSMGKGIE